MAKIIIDLDKVNSPTTYDKKNEVFQHEAIVNINEVFNKLLDFKYDDKKDIHEVRRHDTIFIDGARGSGKTAFLLNIEKRLDEKYQEKCKFFNPIDPTLLEDSENFLGVILGLIVKEIELKCTSNSNQYGMRDYYDSLEKLSKSLGSVKTVSESIGIDEIADFRSSNALENDAHNFFYAVTRLFNVKALVILIDDIDMAFSKGFDVLETIRKKLASPYIIPVVSGDGKLYKKLIRNHFEREITYNKECIDIEKNNPNKELIEQSVDQYFNKVMPNDNRIELKDIFTILKENEVIIKIKEKEIAYSELKDFEIRLINYGINQIQFTKNVFKNNTRSFVQYLAKKREIFEKVNLSDEHISYTKYKIRDDIDKIIDNLTNNEYKKSLTLTQSFYHFSSELQKQQLARMLNNDIKAFNSSKLDTYQVFLGDFFQLHDEEKKYLKLEKEVLNEDLYIVKDGLVKFLNGKKNSIEYLVPRLFTHDDYYSSSSSTRFHFFTGKFIEFIMFSISCNFEDNEKSLKTINEIINKKPYNMKFHSNNYLEEVDIEESDNSVYPKTIDENNELLESLKAWNDKLDKKYMTTLQMHEILNKFFNNINVLKGQSQVKDNNSKKDALNVQKLLINNTPWQIFQRVVIIFINAVASIENKGTISNSNIATSLKAFDWKSLETTSQTYRDNIQPLKKDSSSLVSILFEHPIIEFILDNKEFEDIKFKGKAITYKDIKAKLLPRLTKNIDETNATNFYNEIKTNQEFIKEYNREKKKKDTKEFKVEELRVK